MKKNYFCIINILLLISGVRPVMMIAQSHSDQNYFMIETMIDSLGGNTKDIQYYDGLGRPDVHASNGINTEGLYVYDMTEYDYMGREQKSWLPSVGNTNVGRLSKSQFSIMSSGTYSDSYAYSYSEYDANFHLVNQIKKVTNEALYNFRKRRF